MARRSRFVAIALALGPALPLVGCGAAPASVAAASTAPPVASPRAETLLPPELDVVVRLDVARLRSTLGDARMNSLELRAATGAPVASLTSLLRSRSTAVWLGLRGLPIAHVDGMLVARGDFASIARDRAAPFEGFRAASTSVADAQIFERVDDGSRGAPSLIALVRDDTLVLATPALAPAARRALEGAVDSAKRLDPPADGVVGVAARPARVAPDLTARYPSFASLLAELESLSGSADVDAVGLRVDAAVVARSSTSADRCLRVLSALVADAREHAEGAQRRLARAAAIERDGDVGVRLRLRLPAEATRDLFSPEARP